MGEWTSVLVHPRIANRETSPIINNSLWFPSLSWFKKPAGSSKNWLGLDSILTVYLCEQQRPLATNTRGWRWGGATMDSWLQLAPPTLIWTWKDKMLSLIFGHEWTQWVTFYSKMTPPTFTSSTSNKTPIDNFNIHTCRNTCLYKYMHTHTHIIYGMWHSHTKSRCAI